MRKTSIAAALVASTLLFAVAPAQGDPLVSGYGGPGSGEQDLLGSVLLPSGGDGRDDAEPTSIRAASSDPAASSSPQSAAPPATEPGNDASAVVGGSNDSGGAPGTGSGEPSVSGAPASADAAPSVSAPPRAPGASTTAGGLPVDGSDLLLVLVVLAGLGLVGVASARLARQAPTPA